MSRSGELGGDEALDPDLVPDAPLAPGRRTLTMSLMRVQRSPGASAQASPATTAPATTSGAPAAPAPADAMIVADGTATQPGQMHLAQFMSQLRAQVLATANDALGPVWSATGCPYIETWFARHATTPAAELDRLARSYSGVTAPRAATDYMGPILTRLRAGIARWKAGQGVDGDAAAAGLGIGSGPPLTPSAAGASAASAPAPADRNHAAVQLKSDGTEPAEVGSPAAVLEGLGGGSALDGSQDSRFGAAMSDNFSDVRLHTDQVGARKASELGARAFTVGTHIAFAAGEYRPGTPEGDALMAHELAHVQQQRGGALDGTARKKAEFEGPEGPLEQEADQVAAAAVTQLHRAGTPATARAKSSLSSTLSLKRCTSPTPTPAPAPVVAPPIPTTHGADTHGGVALPDSADQAWLAGHLNPESVAVAPPPVLGLPPPAPVVQHWDGLAANPQHTQNQNTLKREMRIAMRAYLDSQMAALRRLSTAPRVPMAQAGTGAMAGHDTGVQGIAGLANDAVSTTFGGDTAGAALSGAQRTSITGPLQATGASRTLFDQNNLADLRIGMNMNNDGLARDAANWIGTSTPAASGVLSRHHLSTEEAGEQQTFWNTFLTEFLAAGTNQADCLLFQQFGLNTTTDRGVMLGTATDPASFGGDANQAMRATRWNLFVIAIHETMHRRAHPAFAAAQTGQVMREGFCELFSEVVGNTILPILRSGGNEDMRHGIEGQVQPIDVTFIPATYTISGEYQDFYDNAKAIRDGGGGHRGIGDSSCRAAYFQGHVELLGLNPDGTAAAAPPAGTHTMQIPPGLHNVDELATATGISRAQLITDNTGIDTTFPTSAVLTGCRIHVVVSSGAAVEDRAMIAAQNGVSEADLARANPGIPRDATTNRWPALAAGATVLIPVH